MNIEPQRVMVVLTGAATALFLLSGGPWFPDRYRLVARRWAVGLYIAALVVVVVWVALWALGVKF